MASIISLVGGFSLGPEVPTGIQAAVSGSWVSKKRKIDPERTRSDVLSSVSGAYADQFSLEELKVFPDKPALSPFFY